MKVADKGIITILREDYANEARFYASVAEHAFDDLFAAVIVHFALALLLIATAIRSNGKPAASRLGVVLRYKLPMLLALIFVVFGAINVGQLLLTKIKSDFVELSYVDVAIKNSYAAMYYNVIQKKKINDSGLAVEACISAIANLAARDELICAEGSICSLESFPEAAERDAVASMLNDILNNSANQEKLVECKAINFLHIRWEDVRKP